MGFGSPPEGRRLGVEGGVQIVPKGGRQGDFIAPIGGDLIQGRGKAALALLGHDLGQGAGLGGQTTELLVQLASGFTGLKVSGLGLGPLILGLFQNLAGGGQFPFGGGQGESMFKSLYTDAIAKQVTRSGGVGVAASVEREMLKLQGLEEDLTQGA
jgi:hypothetical protein